MSRTAAAVYQPRAAYSDSQQLVYSSKNQLAAALQLAAELIVTGTGVKLLHVTLGGFDTHYTELNRHDDLMGYLDQAVSAFYQDLSAHGAADKVLVVYAKYGRKKAIWLGLSKGQFIINPERLPPALRKLLAV